MGQLLTHSKTKAQINKNSGDDKKIKILRHDSGARGNVSKTSIAGGTITRQTTRIGKRHSGNTTNAMAATTIETATNGIQTSGSKTSVAIGATTETESNAIAEIQNEKSKNSALSNFRLE